MRVFSLKARSNSLLIVLVILEGAFLFTIPRTIAQSTTTQETLDAAAELLAAQGRVNEAREAFVALSSSQDGGHALSSIGIFSPQSPALWVLVAILFGVLLLLFAARRSVQETVLNKPKESVKPPAIIDTPASTEVSMPATPLVQPVKVVKIKVRKLTKSPKR